MPYRLTTARHQPGRTILFAIAVLSLLGQIAAMVLEWPMGISNFAIVAPVCIWTIWAAWHDHLTHEKNASFILCMLWLWTGAAKFVAGPADLEWVPYLIIAAVLSIAFIRVSYREMVTRDSE